MQNIKAKTSMETPENEDDHYRLGLFYVNPKDKKIFVPKRTGAGWTLNFGNIWSYVILIFIIAAIICIKAAFFQSALSTNNHYIAGFIYYNSADARLFIPRTNGTGWTLNFANYWSYFFVGFIVLLAIYSVLRSLDQKK